MEKENTKKHENTELFQDCFKNHWHLFDVYFVISFEKPIIYQLLVKNH